MNYGMPLAITPSQNNNRLIVIFIFFSLFIICIFISIGAFYLLNQKEEEKEEEDKTNNTIPITNSKSNVNIPTTPPLFNPQSQAIKNVKNTSICLDVPESSTSSRYPIQGWNCNSGENQQWSYKNGTLINRRSGLCLDIKNNEIQNGAHVGQYQCITNARNQQWVYNYNKTLTSPLAPGKCLELLGGNAVNGTQTVIWDCNNADHQKWTV